MGEPHVLMFIRGGSWVVAFGCQLNSIYTLPVEAWSTTTADDSASTERKIASLLTFLSLLGSFNVIMVVLYQMLYDKISQPGLVVAVSSSSLTLLFLPVLHLCLGTEGYVHLVQETLYTQISSCLFGFPTGLPFRVCVCVCVCFFCVEATDKTRKYKTDVGRAFIFRETKNKGRVALFYLAISFGLTGLVVLSALS